MESIKGLKVEKKDINHKTIISVGKEEIGGTRLTIIAGPCSVEDKDQIMNDAKLVKSCGANFLRGGIFKPRTSPYSFQGLGKTGLDMIKEAGKMEDMPIVCEIMSIEQLKQFASEIDVIQIGARNMQNFELLKEVGKLDQPVILKRGLSATIEELLLSAEYIMAHGNTKVILCERGIRTFETAYRNVLDLNAVPMLKSLTHLPVIVDVSHSTGEWWMVEDLSLAATAVGADGLMIEVHDNPEDALSDGMQSLKYDVFKMLMSKVEKIAKVVNKSL